MSTTVVFTPERNSFVIGLSLCLMLVAGCSTAYLRKTHIAESAGKVPCIPDKSEIVMARDAKGLGDERLGENRWAVRCPDSWHLCSQTVTASLGGLLYYTETSCAELTVVPEDVVRQQQRQSGG